MNLVSQILKSEAVSSISERERDREDTESRKPAATHSSIHSDEEKRLQEAIQNAMADVASAVTQNKQKVGGSRRNYLFPVFDEDEPPSSADTTTSENTDDEFILIEKIPAKHPACSNNNKLLEPDFEMVSKNVKLPSIGHETDSMHGFIAERPIPRIRYNINKVSFCFYLFAGNDFGTSFGAQKTYSQWETRKDSDECVQCKSIGGRFRDQTVCVETRLTKLQFLWETYNPTSPILSFGTLNLGDIEVTDHLLNSNINKMIYRVRDI